MTHVFKWNGTPLGFIRSGRLFGTDGTYMGWSEPDGTVWDTNGHYIGDLIEGQYILRNSMKITPVPKIPKIPPISPVPPIPPIPRIPRIPRLGWIDPFGD